MAIFKCKMCGGALDVQGGMTVIECDYCGTNQTLPKLDDERRANLYDRANHFRRSNEFDKAIEVYEKILAEDSNDAEAYWSLVLCRYGIEYVKDPASHKRVPTVNRTQYISIFADEDYKSALQYADTHQKKVYEAEAAAIDEIQKGILAVSQKEAPFDVFICYKETDNNGRRTPDSVLATELYHQLVQEGFKVFFARITLEDKIGTAYEPYIFAALNSARVMVVLGTSAEYFNAVWVKNEWSRFLALIKNGEKKTLIPAYRDMDPYELPEEFSYLQAQDMSKLGFMQDLIRGIKKLLSAGEPVQAVSQPTIQPTGVTNIENMLKRGIFALENKEWDTADNFFEQVLNENAEETRAYLGKLLAAYHLTSEEQLADIGTDFSENNNYKMICRLGSAELCEKMKNYNAQSVNIGIYNEAVKTLENAQTEEEFRRAADRFKEIPGFKDVDKKIEECHERAELCRKNVIYNNALQMLENAQTEEECKNAAECFRQILGFKDVDKKIEECHEKTEFCRKNVIYNAALRMLQNAKTEKQCYRAADKFREIPGFKDADKKIEVCMYRSKSCDKNGVYNKALALFERAQTEEEYKQAADMFRSILNWRDSAKQAQICDRKIKKLLEEEQIAQAEAEHKRIIIKRMKYSALAVLIIILTVTVVIPPISKIMKRKEGQSIADLASMNVGDEFTFGLYEQDNRKINGTEPIEWKVINKSEDSILVISKYVLDCMPYNENSNSTWESSTLRNWLNNDFYDISFSEQQKELILRAELTNKDSNGATTECVDKIFLLSAEEAIQYFHSDDSRIAQSTKFTLSKIHMSDNTNAYWWLRTPSQKRTYCMLVYGSGIISTNGWRVHDESIGVRPAMWLSTK